MRGLVSAAIIGFVAMLALAPEPLAAAFVDDFETSYSIGPLNGQNGWINAAGVGLNVAAASGNPGFAAVSPTATSNGSLKYHNVPLANGQTYRFEFDVSVAEGANIYAGLGWTDPTAYINLAAWNSQGANDGFRLETSVGQSQNLSIGLTDQWYHLALDWTIGGNAMMSVLDATNTQIYQTSVDVSGINYTKPALREAVLYSNGAGVAAGTRFDNISFAATGVTNSQLDRGHKILLQRGLQIQAVSYPDYDPDSVRGISDVNRWLSSNFTTLNSWWWTMPDTLAKLPQGSQWGRAWFGSVTDPAFPPLLTSAEMPYVDGFSSMQYLDEPTDEMLTDPTWLTSMRDWYANWHQEYPDALTFSDFSGLNSDAAVANYMQFTQPDMLVFNAYPARASDREYWYSTMQKYRNLSLAGNDGSGNRPIPFGQFVWMSRIGNTYDASLPSESLIRLNQFANWAFGGKWASGWLYTSNPNVELTALFSTDGDTSPTPVFNYVAETNRQSRNLGPALVRMLTTDIRMIPGRNGSSFNSIPDRILTWSAGTANTAGFTDHIVAIQPTVSQGGANDTMYSDILVGYFKPLSAEDNGITFVEGLHFMIVNGSMTGTAAQSAQWYRITFNFSGSDFNSLVRLSRDTGLVELVTLTHTIGSMYYLDLNLPGGTGDLFGFWNSNNPLPTIAPHPGDFDLDGDVDGADFVAWQTNFPKSSGATLAMGDADGDGDVDGADFVVWQTNFPFTPASAQVYVPEPMPWFAIIVSVVAMPIFRRHFFIKAT